MKNIKMRPPIPLFNLFKKSSMILYLVLKAKKVKQLILPRQERRKGNC